VDEKGGTIETHSEKEIIKEFNVESKRRGTARRWR
jgi:hypothetical protein